MNTIREDIKPERNPESSWTVQYINSRYWYFNDMGLPRGPYLTQEEAEESLNKYTWNWYESD